MSDDCIYFPIRKTVRVSFNKKTGTSYIEWWQNDYDVVVNNSNYQYENGRWVGLVIQSGDLPTLKDALEKIEKLLPLV